MFNFFCQEYVRCCNNVNFNLKNVGALQQEHDYEKIEQIRQCIIQETSAKQQRWRTIEEYEDYKRLFHETKPRYPFFVMEGKTQTAKSTWAKGVEGDESKVYYVNAAACLEPDLRKYNFFKHSVILFDEASPKMVINQKVLFQASPQWIKLGQSTTNCYSYDVFVSGVKMIICSNSWAEDLEEMKPEDREWLQENSIYYNTGYTPLYEIESWTHFM